MSAPLRISVIIPSYKSRNLTEVVKAVRALTPIEILVVDSSPSAPAISDTLVTMLRSDAPLSPGAARNRGAAKARGDLLLFVDSDVIMTDAARAFVDRQIQDDSDQIVSGVYSVGGPGRFFSRLQNRILRYRLTEGRDTMFSLFSSSHFLIRREAFKSLGGFNEDIQTYEDVEFLARATKLGMRLSSSLEFEAIHLKEYSPLSLLEDYGKKAYAAFHVRRRYGRIFQGVPSMIGGELQLTWLAGILLWLLLFAYMVLGVPAVIAGPVAVVLFLYPHAFLRRLLRGEARSAAALVLLYWPFMGLSIALAIAVSMVSWAYRRVVQWLFRASDMMRALKRVIVRSGLPVQIIAYVTARCNLRCEHCFYKETLDNPDPGELPLDVFDRTTRSIGPVLWFSLAGGEPFVRKDLSQLIDVVQKNCRPKVFSFPTNGWYTEKTFETSLRVLQRMESGNLILFFSLDGPKEVHDLIRGEGSFDQVKATMARLRPLTLIYPNLYLNVITTVTDRNADLAAEFIDELVRDFSPSAISINLFRYHSLEHPALSTKVLDGYKAAVDAYSKYLREGALKHYGFFGGRILLFKEILQKELIYRVAKFNEFVTPCTAGTLSYVIMEDGRLTPCEILPDTLGNITGPQTFREMVSSEGARKLRAWISDTKCKCTYECAMSTNTLFSWPMSRRMIKLLVREFAFGKSAT